MSLREDSLKIHKDLRGKIEIKNKISVKNFDELKLIYTPGVAEVSKEIAANKEKVYEYTSKWNSVAIVTDGSRVLGLGNIGPEAALPVMEGKSLLFKTFANVDAFPICLRTQDTEEIIATVKNIAPVFGGINIEDIDSPKSFEVEERLENELDIPVFQDDHYGVGIVTLAALSNALKVVGKKFSDVKITIAGAGSAGFGIARMLKTTKTSILVVDSKGIISAGRKDLNKYKQSLLEFTNKENLEGTLKDAMKDSDVFIGVSAVPNLTDVGMIKTMADDSIVFALSNPDPEIDPEEAKRVAKIVATGRSDYPNQVNNALVFPGLFRGVLDAHVKKITEEIRLTVADTLTKLVNENELNEENIIPKIFNKNVVLSIAEAVSNAVESEKFKNKE